jgi:hypothetical protein
MASISPICKKCKNFISALKSPTYIDFMIKKSLKSKTSKSHTWAPLNEPPHILQKDPPYLTSTLVSKTIPQHTTQPHVSRILHSTLQRHMCRKFETNIPRKGITRLQSQFLHSCFYERFMYMYIPLIGLPILLQENRWAERGNI